MRKIIILIIASFTLTACINYVEINDLAILTGIIIDYKDNKYEITTQVILNEKESEVKIYKTKATSIDEALAELSKVCNKKVFISHLKVLMITENIINDKKDFQEFFLRNSKLKMNFYTFFIESKDINNLININQEKEGAAIYVDNMMKFNQEIFSSSIPLKFIDLAYYSKEKGIDIVYPKIELKENNKEKSLYLASLISFDKNNNMINFNEKESILYNILTNKAKITTLDINCGNKNFTVEMQNIKTKLSYKDNRLYIDIISNGKVKDYNCTYNSNDIETTKKLNNLTNNYLQKETNNFIKNMKKYNKDFIGIGFYLYKHEYKKFKEKVNNNTYLDNIDIKINSNIKINTLGELKK